ncbi:MAG: WYL domain-containing protein [Planctomycetota bacterium]
MNLKRTTRLLKLLQTLQSGQGQNADGLAAACGVGRRTIFRDLETLREAGVPLHFDKADDRYSIPESFFLPSTNFTPAEALSLLVLAGKLGPNDPLPFLEPARAAALKLESSLPGALRDEVRTLTRAIQVRVDQINPLDQQQSHYEQLVDAIAERRVLRMEYDSFTEYEVITTKLRPYRLIFSRRSWYVIGRSSLHDKPRTFNVSRITRLTKLKEKYAMPRGFSVDRYLGNAWHLIPSEGRDYDVTIRFQPLVARNVAEVVWHKTQEIEQRQDGSIDFHCRVSGLSEITWWLLGYGDQAEVIRPARLRAIVAGRAAAMHRLYNEQADAPAEEA